MTARLKRYQHEGDLHLVTFSCYRRRPYLQEAAAKDRFETSLEAARVKHGFQVIAYVVMPEHVHLLLTEPPATDLWRVMNGLKVSVAKHLPESPFWTARYHDFNVFSRKKTLQKILYIHQNPVSRGLEALAEEWKWSSLRQYSGQPGTVTVETGRGIAPDTFRWDDDAGE